jgi:predicted RNase H-like HicB family nuclease
MKSAAIGKIIEERNLESDMKYKVNHKKTDEGYAVWRPGLPGCLSQGETEDEALETIKDTIQLYL